MTINQELVLLPPTFIRIANFRSLARLLSLSGSSWFFCCRRAIWLHGYHVAYRNFLIVGAEVCCCIVSEGYGLDKTWEARSAFRLFLLSRGHVGSSVVGDRDGGSSRVGKRNSFSLRTGTDIRLSSCIDSTSCSTRPSRSAISGSAYSSERNYPHTIPFQSKLRGTKSDINKYTSFFWKHLPAISVQRASDIFVRMADRS